MQRLRLLDVRNSRLPRVLGYCQNDTPRIAEATNTAQRRLLFCKEAGDEGWYGTWAEILFYVSQTTPYITTPREVARIELANICSYPFEVQNQFAEYLRFGNGRMPKCPTQCGNPLQIYSRNNAVTFVDLTSPPQLISVFLTDAQDVGKRVLIQGTDQNSNPVYSQDVLVEVQGVYVYLDSSFVTTPMSFNTITGIQKDQTAGQVKIYQTDPTSGEQVLLLTMEPSETTASYRRYFLNPLPRNCCGDRTGSVQNIPVTAIAKLELIPVQVDTDYLLIQDLEAVINEAQSARLSEVDNEASQKMSLKFHNDAIRSLNGQLVHYVGAKTPAVRISPFGSASLERQMIGRLM